MHVRACIAQFVADGVEDDEVIDLASWHRSVARHTGKLFKVDREPAIQSLLDHCVSFNTHPVVAGSYAFWLFWLLVTNSACLRQQITRRILHSGAFSAWAYTTTRSSSAASFHFTARRHLFTANAPSSRNVRK